MEIIYLKLGDIHPYEKNPRNNDQAVDAVAASIKEFGFKVPIIIDKDNIIVAGHTRYKAATKLGFDEVPCIKADDLTEEQIKAFRLADNKVSELAEWDFQLLGEELEGITMDMEQFGFDLLQDEEQKETPTEIIEDNVPETPEEPKAKYGDVYMLGNHRLMCGDSTKSEDVAKLMDGVTADSVTGGGLHGKDLSKADVSVNIYAFLKAQKEQRPIELCCAIGDETIDGKPYSEIVEIARDYINKVGGFEKFAEWGLY